MSRGLRWLRLAAVCAVFLVGLPLLLRGRVTAGASVLYNVLLGGTALLLFTPRQGRRRNWSGEGSSDFVCGGVVQTTGKRE